MSVTPYELRVASADRPHATYLYGRDAATAVVVLARTTSGSGGPRWMARAAERINAGEVETIAAARQLAAECRAMAHRPGGRPAAAARIESARIECPALHVADLDADQVACLVSVIRAGDRVTYDGLCSAWGITNGPALWAGTRQRLGRAPDAGAA